jgi:hypothetical protein
MFLCYTAYYYVQRRGNLFVCLMLFSATFNNISAISWRQVIIGGGNRRTWRNKGNNKITELRTTRTSRKSLTNFIT